MAISRVCRLILRSNSWCAANLVKRRHSSTLARHTSRVGQSRCFWMNARHGGNFLRTLALPEAVEHWSLTTLRNKLIRIGAKVVRHGRYVTIQLAGVAISRALFAMEAAETRWTLILRTFAWFAA